MYSRIASVIFALLFAIAPIWAQQSDIKPKFGKPPPANVKKRITVFIAPPEPASDAPDSAPVPEQDPERSSHASWFWSEIQPTQRAGFASGDLDRALEVVKRSAPDGWFPTAQDMHQMLQRWNGPILMSAGAANMSPALVAAVIWVESRGQVDAVSPAAAQGLMQLIPATATRFGVTDPFDPMQNVNAGATYLAWLLDKFQSDPILMLAGYNAGENAVMNAGGVPDYSETRDYVPKVLAAYSIARLICKTPPILVTDGCVFQLPAAQ